MKLWSTESFPAPKWLKHWVHDHNFCEDVKSDGTEKAPSRLFNLFYKYFFFPFEHTDCWCCAALRGLTYGFILGYVVGKLLN